MWYIVTLYIDELFNRNDIWHDTCHYIRLILIIYSVYTLLFYNMFIYLY